MYERFGDQLKVEESLDKVTLKVGEKVLFTSGSARLSAPAVATLAELANSIKLLEGDVIIEGHTDNIPVVGGPFKSNWELSAARAFSVINALSDNGVDAKRLAAWGFGENRPVVANDTADNRSKNRRIEVIVMRKKMAV
jgi:chemotaxis protein MotB